MRYINKTISLSFVRDWCLKCSRYLKSTEVLYSINSKLERQQVSQSSPFQRSKTGGTAAGRPPRILARHALQHSYLDEREFLCLMCNSFDR